MTENDYSELLKALTLMGREKAKRVMDDFVKHVNDGNYSREQLVDAYNAIIQRLLSPE